MSEIKPSPTPVRIVWLFFLVIAWFLITQFTPFLNKLYDFRSVNPWLLAYIRMALMLIVTWFYVSICERKSFYQVLISILRISVEICSGLGCSSQSHFWQKKSITSW